MRVVLKIVVGLLACIGVLASSLWIFVWINQSQFCEQQVLARAVSPSGAFAAEHYRKRCDDERPDEYFLKVGSPWQGRESTYTQTTLRSDAAPNATLTLSMQPLRMWWTSDTKLHIEPHPHDSIKVPTELHGVSIETQPYQ